MQAASWFRLNRPGISQLTGEREPPSLQRSSDYGTHSDRITLEAWAKFDAAMEDWKAFVRGGGLHESY